MENGGYLGTKKIYENIYINKHKQIRINWQTDKLEQWVLHLAFKHEVLGSILTRKN